MKLSWVDYTLFAVGIFTLPLFIGFIILGVAMWRIGGKLQKESSYQQNYVPAEQSTNQNSEYESLSQTKEERNILSLQQERFKLEEYSKETLEHGK